MADPQQSAAPRYVQLPNGSYMEWPEGISAEEFKAKAAKVGSAPDQPESDSGTFGGAVGNVLSRVGSNIAGMAKPFMQSPATTLEGIASRQGSQMRGEKQPDLFSDFATTAHQDVPKAFENLAGDVGTAALVGGVAKIPGLAKVGMENLHPTSSPEIVPPIQTAAEKLAGSIVPKAKQIPGFVNDIQRNAGNIRDYVKETGNPLKTQAEFEKAVTGAGNKRYQHFTQNILEPIADQPVQVPENYGGQMTGEGTARLGDIHQRIGRLNNLTSPAYAKANPGDVQTALAKIPMEQLQAEHAAITPVFQDAVAKATGIPAEDIANLRQDFGSLRGLGNTVTEARAGRIAKVGAGAEGSTSPQLHASPLSFINQGIDLLRGGRTAIADRALQRAWKGFEPLAGEGRPLPQSPEGFQLQRAFQESANQEAAKAEAARMHETETAAQNAATERAQRAQGLRTSRRATAAEGTKLQGEAARTLGRRNVLNQRSQ